MKKRRIERLKELLAESDLSGIVVTDMKNVRYLCGFSGSDGALVVTQEDGVFLTDGRYTIQAADEVDVFPVREYKNKIKAIASAICDFELKRVGIESHHMTLFFFENLGAALDGVELFPLKRNLAELRMIKDDEEIALLSRAVKIAEDALTEIIPLLTPDTREDDIAVELEYKMKGKGSSALPFPVIVASGDHGALAHAKPGRRQLKSGDLLIIDFGAAYGGYASDETVTFMIGKEDPKSREVYEVVRGAQRQAISAVKPGVSVQEVDREAREYIAEHGFGEFFNHGTGHGVGLDVHELPVVSFSGEGELAAGMVITIEPGIYIAGWGGIRLEDMVLVTEKGSRLLTTLSKSFKVVP
jgi:Xaa-Pro aminopeptidase